MFFIHCFFNTQQPESSQEVETHHCTAVAFSFFLWGFLTLVDHCQAPCLLIEMFLLLTLTASSGAVIES